jgi:hypothetical protein
MLIFSHPAISPTVTLLLWGIRSLALPSFCAVVAVVGQPECSVSVTLVWPFLTFQSTHTQLSEIEHCPHTVHTFTEEFVHLAHLLPTKNVLQIVAPPCCSSQVSLPCSLLRRNSHTNCKVNRLALPTSHMTPYNTPPTTTPPPFLFCLKI